MMDGAFQFSTPPEAGGAFLALPGMLPAGNTSLSEVTLKKKKKDYVTSCGSINLAVSQQIISVRSWMVCMVMVRGCWP